MESRNQCGTTKETVSPVRLQRLVYASEHGIYDRHVGDPDYIGGREPFGPEHFGLELNAERLKSKGLWGVSPLYVNPVNG